VDEYIELLILVYFKEYGQNYSIFDLKEKIGVSLAMLNNVLDNMLEIGILCINNNLLEITQSGRVLLGNSEMETYSFCEDNFPISYNIEKWPIDKVYPIQGFSKNKWRGSGK
jgi:predicted methyltransferase